MALSELFGTAVDDNEDLVDQWEDLCARCSHRTKFRRVQSIQCLRNPSRRRTVSDLDQEMNQGVLQAVEPPVLPTRRDLGWWPKRRTKKTITVSDHRELVVRQLADLVFELRLPVCEILEASQYSDEAAQRLSGGRRPRTIERYLRLIRKIIAWCQRALGSSWFTQEIQVVDYLIDLGHEPCAPSIPRGVLSSLDFLENIGNVEDTHRLSSRPLVCQVAKDLEVELKMASLGRIRRKAPPMLLAMVMSYEVTVVDLTNHMYVRLFAWFKLIKHWMQLRFGDTLFMPPRLARMAGGTLTAIITMTKTTGPGKKVETLEAYVTDRAWILEPVWLGTGWRLFLDMGAVDHSMRDYWMPLPTPDLESVTSQPLSYVDSAAITRKMLNELHKVDVVVHVEVVWEKAYRLDGSKIPLLERGLGGFWTEHGDRATFSGWLHELGYSSEDRKMAGRWSPETSDEYLRVARTTVTRVQAESARRIRTRLFQSDLGESETLDKLRNYMLARGFSPEDIEVQMVKLQVPHLAWREPKSGPQEPGLAAAEPVEDLEDDGFGHVNLAREGLEVNLPIPDEEEACQPEIPEGSWVVSCEKAGKHRTLHQVGRCWRKPGVHYQWYERISDLEAQKGVDKGSYTSGCRDCFKSLSRDVGVSESESSSSSSSS